MIPVILSGGSGTRLWPVSRASYPKQFCEFYDQSFLKNSISRLRVFGEPSILTVATMEALTAKTLREMGISPDHAIYEPMAKNTAPAIALLCHVLALQGKAEEVVGVFPADHLVTDEKAFQEAVELGVKCAEQGEVVTLGIQPSYASTGYGYIEVKEDVFLSGSHLKAHRVEGFREKPDEKTAQEFLESGRHYWNAGMFIFRVSVMIDHLKKYLPEVWERISGISSDLSDAKYAYALLESVSIDYGVMEKLEQQVCIPCNIGWSDVGSWDELARLSEELPSLKTDSKALVFNEGSSSNFIFSVREKVIGLIDVHNLIIVDTPDALLISKKGQSQKVKQLVDGIRQAGSSVATDHPFEHRPWGGFEVLAEDKRFKAKTIQVDPGAKLSYQSHTRRAEHWIMIEGEAEVTLNDVPRRLKAGEYIHIPMGAKHRIENVGTGPLIFVEVQTGSYFGEDDITRYQDDYGRS